MKIKMSICPECEKPGFPREERTRVWKVRGEDITVDGSLNYCPHCGILFLDDNYNELQMSAYREYRARHNLLTPDEIRGIRERYGFSQELFARILGIGVASLRRYESGALQTSAIDSLLQSANSVESLREIVVRNSRDLGASELERVTKKLDKILGSTRDKESALGNLIKQFTASMESVNNGFKPFSFDKLKGLVAYLLELNNGNISITKMCKLMFYCDFSFFKENTQSISGLSYVHYTYGPVPEGITDMYNLFNYLEESGVITVEEEECQDCEGIRRDFSLKDFQASSLLDEEERNLVKKVFEKLGHKSAKILSAMSHREIGYMETENHEPISYEYASELKGA
jgi:putative zinc finger/helix-turn-helix YgiT family protein